MPLFFADSSCVLRLLTVLTKSLASSVYIFFSGCSVEIRNASFRCKFSLHLFFWLFYWDTECKWRCFCCYLNSFLVHLCDIYLAALCESLQRARTFFLGISEEDKSTQTTKLKSVPGACRLPRTGFTDKRGKLNVTCILICYLLLIARNQWSRSILQRKHLHSSQWRGSGATFLSCHMDEVLLGFLCHRRIWHCNGDGNICKTCILLVYWIFLQPLSAVLFTAARCAGCIIIFTVTSVLQSGIFQKFPKVVAVFDPQMYSLAPFLTVLWR